MVEVSGMKYIPIWLKGQKHRFKTSKVFKPLQLYVQSSTVYFSRIRIFLPNCLKCFYLLDFYSSLHTNFFYSSINSIIFIFFSFISFIHVLQLLNYYNISSKNSLTSSLAFLIGSIHKYTISVSQIFPPIKLV